VAIIIERTDPSGHILQQQRFETSLICIGRSFNADFRLDDPYVDANHALLSADENSGQLRIKDCGGKNGLWWLDEKQQKHRVISERALASGQTLLLGKTYLRIYHHSHPVPPALSIARDDAITNFFGHAGLIVCVALFGLGLDVLGQYLDRPMGGSWVERGKDAFFGLLGLIALSSFWALLGKGLVQHGRFRFHLGLSLCVMAIWVFWEFIQPALMYNFNLGQSSIDWITRTLQVVLLAGAFYLALSFSTRLSKRIKCILTALIPLFILGSATSDLLEKNNRFRSTPPYSHVLVEPAIQWRGPVAWDQLAPAIEKTYRPYEKNVDDEIEANEDSLDAISDSPTTAED
jgi:hypothetical protein